MWTHWYLLSTGRKANQWRVPHLDVPKYRYVLDSILSHTGKRRGKRQRPNEDGDVFGVIESNCVARGCNNTK